MAHYRDLEPCDYFGECGSVLRAVGWLSSSGDYPRGKLAEVDFSRLKSLAEKSWQPFYFHGDHVCELCDDCFGTKNLFVPGDGFIYVSPEMIVHYVADHSYAPPSPFLHALEACPEMGSPAYLAALVAQGGQEFAELVNLAEPTPCPFCGGPLVTPRAKQCRFCKMDWHDRDHPRKLGSSKSTEPGPPAE